MDVLRTISFAAACVFFTPAVQAQMSHSHGGKDLCGDTSIRCATKATPYFAPDHSLWLAWMTDSFVSVARSTDLGRTWSPAALVNTTPLQLDWGPDARPHLVVDREGRISVAFAYFKDKAFNGRVMYASSTDGGQHFSEPQAMTSDPESQRFEGLALDSDGSIFAAWLDKRNRALPATSGKYVGAGLAFSWSHDGGRTFSESRIAQDNTCECCRLGIGFAGPRQPVVIFRSVFDQTTRDHAVITFVDPQTPGPVRRVSVDDWKTDACPHHGPSLSIAPDGAYHATWFTNGSLRQGLFYARSTDQGATFSEPMPIGDLNQAPSHPFVLADRESVLLTWKEFDGDFTAIRVMRSGDRGRTWSKPMTVARTDKASDHPLLITDGHKVFLSWLSQTDGYRLISLEDTQ